MKSPVLVLVLTIVFATLAEAGPVTFIVEGYDSQDVVIDNETVSMPDGVTPPVEANLVMVQSTSFLIPPEGAVLFIRGLSGDTAAFANKKTLFAWSGLSVLWLILGVLTFLVGVQPFR